MTTTSSRSRQRRALAVAVASVGLLGAAVAPSFAAAGSHHATKSAPAKAKNHHAVVAGSRYLALGDSISFGYREANSIPAPTPNKAKTAVGFPEDVAANLGLKLANASCPGETTASFLNTKAQSNGCENLPPKKAKGGYRTVYPLHVKYASKHQSQMAYAETYLRKHPNTRLVTLMLGANDGFLCQETTSDGCVSEITSVTDKITKNGKKIFKGLRDKAHYKGQIVVLSYYSLDYSNGTDNLESFLVSKALRTAGKGFHIEVANGYGQFKAAAKQSKGDTCAAGLLTVLKNGTTPCGVHTSPSGSAVLAQAVEQAIKK